METKLLQVYQHALEEYRFEVKLSWDRAKFYMILNSPAPALCTDQSD